MKIFLGKEHLLGKLSSKMMFLFVSRFNADFLGKGEIGAYCVVDEYLVKKHIQLNKELNSWSVV